MKSVAAFFVRGAAATVVSTRRTVAAAVAGAPPRRPAHARRPPDPDATAAEALLDALPERATGAGAGKDAGAGADVSEWLRSRERDAARARALAGAAADRGCARGATILGYLWRDGLGGPRDAARAKQLLATGADGGDPFAKLALGNMLVGELDGEDDPDLHDPTSAGIEDNNHQLSRPHPEDKGYSASGSSSTAQDSLDRHDDAENHNHHHNHHHSPQERTRGSVRGQVIVETDPSGVERARMHLETVGADGTSLGSLPPDSPAQLVRRIRKERRVAGFTDQQAEEFERHREHKARARRDEQRQEAIRLLQGAIDGGVQEASVALGNALIREDPVAAVELYEKAASEAHVPSAHFNLGQVYYSGMDGVAQDDKLALKHFSMAAQLGDANAQFFVGHVYRVGDLGVNADAVASLQYVEMAAAQGHPGATYYLALMHRNGEADLQPSLAAFRLHLDEACELGHGEALACRADMLYKGTDGVSVDLEKALRDYELAGAAGETAALCSAAAMHFHGFGTKADHHKAFLLYQTAAVEGSTTALQNLGSMYYHGHGVPKNTSIAEHFFLMVEKATREELEESERLSKEGIRIEKANPRAQPHTQVEADLLRPPEALHEVDRVS